MTLALAFRAEREELSAGEMAPLSPVSLAQASQDHVDEGKLPAELRQNPGVFLQAQMLVERFESSPTAISRLAAAALNAGHLNVAQNSARRALLLASKTGDVSSLLAAAKVLVTFGEFDSVEEALRKHRETLGYELAEVLAFQGRFAEALEFTQNDDRPATHALRGWLLLMLHRYAEAIHELRSSIRLGEVRVDVLTNLGYAYGALGARAKAVGATKQALHLSPADTTVGLNLAGLLSLSGNHSEALSVLELLREKRPSDLSVVQAAADILLQQEKEADALRELRRARDSVDARSTPVVQIAELRAKIAFVEWMVGRRPKSATLDRLRGELLRTDYLSLEIGYLIAHVLDSPSDVNQLETLYDGFRSHFEASDLLFLQARLAYLKADYDHLVEASKGWALNEPFDVSAHLLAVVVIGDLGEGYQAAAAFGLEALKRMPTITMLANNTAYVFALAGQPTEARKVLPADRSSPYVKATEALIKLVEGDVQGARAGYLKAAELAAKSNDPELAFLIGAREKLARIQLGIDPYDEEFVRELDSSDSERSRLLAAAARRFVANNN
jgi:Flp pilus assembly protein TadD